MRMTSDELVAQTVRHLIEVEAPPLAGDFRMQHGLQQNIAQLIANLSRITSTNGLSHFVSFFDHMRNQ